jgi:hypothetical protein
MFAAKGLFVDSYFHEPFARSLHEISPEKMGPFLWEDIMVVRCRNLVRSVLFGCCFLFALACGGPAVEQQVDPGIDLPFDLEKADGVQVISKHELPFGTVEDQFEQELEYHAYIFYALPDSTIRISTQDAERVDLAPEDQARDLDIRVYGPASFYGGLKLMKAEGTYDVGNPGHASVTIQLPDQNLRTDGNPEKGCMYRVLVNTVNGMRSGHYALTLECEGGACICDQGATTCAVGCVDLKTDYHNCGTCGNSCDDHYSEYNQECQQGKCVPPCTKDRFEPNDEAANAHALSIEETVFFRDVDLCDGEDDWFRIDLTEPEWKYAHAINLAYESLVALGPYRSLNLEVYEEDDLSAPVVQVDTTGDLVMRGPCIERAGHGDHLLIRVYQTPGLPFVGAIPYGLYFFGFQGSFTCPGE